MDVGQRLKMRRNELNLKQEYVAEELGITRQTISNWENGRSYPDIARIIRLSEIYGLSLDELLKGDQEMVKHLQENTVVNHFLKIFIGMLFVNVLLMLFLLVNQNMSETFLFVIFVLIGANCLSLFYLIIKKIQGLILMNQTTIMILLMSLLILAAACMCYYIFSLVMIDAKSRGIKNPKFWSLIATGGQNGGGLLLYLFTRRKTTSTMNSAETEQFLRIKRKIYCLLVVLFFLFLLFIATIFRFT